MTTPPFFFSGGYEYDRGILCWNRPMGFVPLHIWLADW